MGFYDDEETARQYISMAEGYDGRELIEILSSHLPQKSSVLEIGMGPGVDLKILKQHFQVTGSDNSQFFLDRYRNSNPDADLLFLDAVELDTKRTFDCIYSNKVLHHLTNDELATSLGRQKAILADNGLVMHSFWRGEGTEEHFGLKFVNHTESSLRSIFGDVFNIVDIVTYKEMEEDDSLYVLASV
jgi:cyclopropane fatty-acyl-phospholipid synthase-like methyltransferase